jgi:nitrite reductase/ring-hydroxylating ferredoxin subunit
MPRLELSEEEARPRLLCDSTELSEAGRAVVFDVMEWGRKVSAFALRFEGKVVAYVNRCVHVPVEMDWQPGEFLDSERRWIICSIHGASYDPRHGGCVGGPCGRGRLKPIRVAEADGRVHWYPSDDIRPVPAGVPNPPDSSAGPAG